MAMKEGIRIPAGQVFIYGDLYIPTGAKGLVLFAHGSGSSRFSPRNRFVADVMNQVNLATLLLDLLTEEEERIDEITSEFRFDIERLTDRLMDATDWVRNYPETSTLNLGYFGASTGAAAAMIAASRLERDIKALVSRGGRVDLSADVLPDIPCPTILIVGELDTGILEINEDALKSLKVEKKLVVVPGATHLFEEQGALEEVARQSSGWFKKYLE